MKNEATKHSKPKIRLVFRWGLLQSPSIFRMQVGFASIAPNFQNADGVFFNRPQFLECRWGFLQSPLISRNACGWFASNRHISRNDIPTILAFVGLVWKSKVGLNSWVWFDSPL